VIPGKVYSFDETLAIVWRRRWQILIPCLLAVAGAAAVAARLPDRYRSETLIMVVPQRIPEEYVRPTVTARIEDRLQSIRQFLLSRSTLERIILEFDLYKNERQQLAMEDVVARIRDDIDIQLDRGEAFRVIYEADQPSTAQKVTARLASLISEENARDRQGLATDTSEFLESELKDAERRLAEQERKLAAFRQENAGELPDQLGSIMQAIQNRQLQLQSLSDSLARDKSEKLLAERLRADLSAAAAVPDTVPPAPAYGSIDTAPALVQLEAARAELRRLLLNRTQDHPDIRAAQRRVDALELRVKEEAERATGAQAPSATEIARMNRLKELDAQILNLERQVTHKETTEKQIQEEIRMYQGRAEAVPLRESQLAALTRGHETLQQTYRELLQKREDSKIAANLERRRAGEQFNILDPAGLPERPFSPNRPLILLIGSLIGLTLGVSLAAFQEFRDASLRTEVDVQLALDLPVLAVVPVLQSLSERARARRLGRTVVLAAGVAIVVLGLVFSLRFDR